MIDLFCGHYTFGAGAGAMLFRTLPDPLHVSLRAARPRRDEVLRMLSALMRGEAEHEGDGTAAILSALCTVLLAMVLRTSRGSRDRADAVDRGRRRPDRRSDRAGAAPTRAPTGRSSG